MDKKYTIDEIFDLFGESGMMTVNYGFLGEDISIDDCKSFLSKGHTPKQIIAMYLDRIDRSITSCYTEKKKYEFFNEKKNQFLNLKTFCEENNYNLRYFTEYENTYGIMEDIFIEREIYSRKNNKRKGYIYIYKDGDLYKIGKTVDITKRNKSYITENPRSKLLHSYFCDDYSKEEARLHEHFLDKRKIGEWFELSDDDLSYLLSL